MNGDLMTPSRVSKVIRSLYISLLFITVLFRSLYASNVVPVRAYNKTDSFELIYSWGERVPYQVEEKKGQIVILFNREANNKNIGFMDLPDFVTKINVRNKEDSLITEISLSQKVKTSSKWNKGDFILTLLKPKTEKPSPHNLEKEDTKKQTKTTETSSMSPSKLPIILESSPKKGDRKTKNETLKLKSTDPFKIGVVQRGNKLYVAIDKSVLMDFSRATPKPDSFFCQIKQMDITDSGIMEIDLSNNPRITLVKEKDGWGIKFSTLEEILPQTVTETDLHKITIRQTGDGKPYLNMELAEPTVIYAIQDPLTDLPLAIVPTATPFLLSKSEKYPDLEILPSISGVSILSKTDDLIVTLDQNNIQVGTIEGIYISSDQDKKNKRTVGKPEPLLFYDTDFMFNKKPLHTAMELYTKSLANAKGLEKDVQRLDYAFYLLSNGLYMEAYGQIRLLEMEKPDFFLLPKYLALKVMTAVLADRYDVAAKTLENPLLKNEEDIQVWKAAVLAHDYKIREAYDLFFDNLHKFKNHPPYVLNKLVQLSTRAALLLNKTPQPFLEKIKGIKVSPQEQDYLKFYEGKEHEFSHRNVNALETFQDLIKKTPYKDLKIKAELAHIQLELKLGTLKETNAIEQLEKIRFSWSGDETNRDILKLLGNLYVKNKQYEKAIDAYKEIHDVLSHIPGSEDTFKVLTDIYSEALLKKDYKDPMDFVSFYKNYSQYLPQDERKQKIWLKAFHAYAYLDLVEDTEQLVEQLKTDSQNEERIVPLTYRLVRVCIQNGNANKALQILEHDLPQNLSDDLDMERKTLLVKAYLIQKKYENALKILSSSDPQLPNRKEILLQIALEKKDWPTFQQILKEDIHRSPLPATLQEDQILNYTLAVYHNDNEEELAYLRDNLEKAIKSPQNKAIFHLLTQKKEPSVFTDDTVIQALNETQKYVNFSKEYMKGGK